MKGKPARPAAKGGGKPQQKKPKEDYGWMDDEARGRYRLGVHELMQE